MGNWKHTYTRTQTCTINPYQLDLWLWKVIKLCLLEFVSNGHLKTSGHLIRLLCVYVLTCVQLRRPWNSPGKNTGVGCHFLLQEIFLTQGSNSRLLHWQADSFPLFHLRSPTKLLTNSYWEPIPGLTWTLWTLTQLSLRFTKCILWQGLFCSWGTPGTERMSNSQRLL